MEDRNEETLKILNYNILAQSLLSESLNISKEQLKYVPFLNINYRFDKIFGIINGLKPDICLFQEFEQNGLLNQRFEANNCCYKIFFKKRPGKHDDGCAIAYNTKKFKLENYFFLELRLDNKSSNSPYILQPKSKKSKNQNLYEKENVAIFLLLKSYKTNFYYLFISSHLLFNSSRGDIKLGQIYQILQSAILLRSYYKDKNINIVLGADLNSTPTSAIYEFITSKTLDVEFLNASTLSGQTYKNYKMDTSNWEANNGWYTEIINTFPKFIDHNIILKQNNYSKYKYDKYGNVEEEQKKSLILENRIIMNSFYRDKNGKEPDITSLSKGFKGTFDYIFYNSNLHININFVLNLTNFSFNIPDKDLPSDHLPLFVEFNIHD